MGQRREIERDSLPRWNTDMKTTRYVSWQEQDMWLGYLEDYPDYRTQSETLEELQENLRDIYHEVTSGVMS
jgi:predicted RNase H-like HicB family nuclease